MGSVIRDLDLRNRVERDPEVTLAELGLSKEDRAGLLSSKIGRLLAYHEMAHRRIFVAIRTFIGRASEVVGDQRLRTEVDAFIAEQGPVTPYLRDIPAEFLAWVRPRWAQDSSIADWVTELADLEILTRQVRNAPASSGVEQALTEVGLDGPVICNPTIRLVRYRYHVQSLPKGALGPGFTPKLAEGEGCWLIAYRHPDEQVHFVDIKERSAQLLRRLLEGQTLREALFGACEATGETLDDEILAVTASTLMDLGERQILLGAPA